MGVIPYMQLLPHANFNESNNNGYGNILLQLPIMSHINL